MLLREIYESGHYIFSRGPFTWEEALYECVKPLTADGTVDSEYGDEIVESVRKYGPYIVLTPHVAMPHSIGGSIHAHGTAIGFMHTDFPVSFGDNDDAQVQTFFTLCATDSSAHLKNMSQLAEILCDHEILERLMAIKEPEELLEIDELIPKSCEAIL